MAEVAMQDAEDVSLAAQQLRELHLPINLARQDFYALQKSADASTTHRLLDQMLSRLSVVAQHDAEFNDGDRVADCERALRSLIDAQQDAFALSNAVQRATAHSSTGPTSSVSNYIRERLEVSKTSYRDRDDKSRYMTDRSFIRFKESVWAVQSEDDFPPMASFFESANGAAEGDDDVEMTSRGPRSLRCPLTLTRLVEPVRSRKCPHTFSKAAILQMLKGHEKGCPVAGCPQRISPADLEQDRITERLLEQAANRELDNEGPDGGDQVDESGQAGDDFLVL